MLIAFLRTGLAGVILCLFLVACGGGGSGGSSGSSADQSSNSPPRFTSPTSFTFEENRPINFLLTVTDADVDIITIRDDANGDGALFLVTITDEGGRVTLNPTGRTLNFEQPEDVNQDNVYEQTITLSDGKATTSAVIRVTVTDVDDPPMCTQAVRTDWRENDTGLVHTFDGEDEDGPGVYGPLQLIRFPFGDWTRADYESAFRLDQATGELFLDRAFDADRMYDQDVIEFSVSYSQAGVEIYCTLTVAPVNVETIVTSGVRLNGAVRSTTNLGDLDGDNLDELWVQTAIGDSINGTQPEAYIVQGNTLRDAFAETGAGDIDLASLGPADAVRIFALFPLTSTGVQGGAEETFFARKLGDVDGDGVPEILVGVRPGSSSQDAVANLNRPYAYLLWGSALATSGGSIDLLNISPAQGLVISGSGSVSRRGLDAASGDFDGDGIPDIAISLSDRFVAADPYAPLTHVIFGDNLLSSRASGALRVDGNNEVAEFGVPYSSSAYSGMGHQLLSPGDIDGDGMDDLFSAARNQFMGYIPGSVISSAPRNEIVNYFGDALPISYSGRSPRFNHQDFDSQGDGVQDLLFTYAAGSFESGDLAMIASGQLIADNYPPGPVGSLNLDSAVGSRILYEANTSGAADIIGIGDIDGDGLQDLAMGIPQFSQFNEGPVVRIVFGSTLANSPTQRLNVGALASGEGLEIRGIPKGGLGLITGLSSIADIDGDNRMDLVLTSPSRGEVYIVPSTDITGAVNADRSVLELEPRFGFEPLN